MKRIRKIFKYPKGQPRKKPEAHVCQRSFQRTLLEKSHFWPFLPASEGCSLELGAYALHELESKTSSIHFNKPHHIALHYPLCNPLSGV